MAWKMSAELGSKITHYAAFPQTGELSLSWLPGPSSLTLVIFGTGVSLRQMVMFGQNPSQGTLLKASQFLSGASFFDLGAGKGFEELKSVGGWNRRVADTFGASSQGVGGSTEWTT